jgi:hypothetical protein
MLKRAVFVVTMVGLLALPMVAAAETWKDVPIVDTLCVSTVKKDPDKHTTQCALQCVKGGYGLPTPDGAYLKFDAAGNEKTIAALKATTKTDHLRATVVGDPDGENIKVTSISIE